MDNLKNAEETKAKENTFADSFAQWYLVKESGFYPKMDKDEIDKRAPGIKSYVAGIVKKINSGSGDVRSWMKEMIRKMKGAPDQFKVDKYPEEFTNTLTEMADFLGFQHRVVNGKTRYYPPKELDPAMYNDMVKHSDFLGMPYDSVVNVFKHFSKMDNAEVTKVEETKKTDIESKGKFVSGGEQSKTEEDASKKKASSGLKKFTITYSQMTPMGSTPSRTYTQEVWAKTQRGAIGIYNREIKQGADSAYATTLLGVKSDEPENTQKEKYGFEPTSKGIKDYVAKNSATPDDRMKAMARAYKALRESGTNNKPETFTREFSTGSPAQDMTTRKYIEASMDGATHEEAKEFAQKEFETLDRGIKMAQTAAGDGYPQSMVDYLLKTAYAVFDKAKFTKK